MLKSTSVLGLSRGILPSTNKITGLTKRTKVRVAQQIADLRWRIEFTEMKLNRWEGYENKRWLSLVKLQEDAKKEFWSLTGQPFAFN